MTRTRRRCRTWSRRPSTGSTQTPTPSARSTRPRRRTSRRCGAPSSRRPTDRRAEEPEACPEWAECPAAAWVECPTWATSEPEGRRRPTAVTRRAPRSTRSTKDACTLYLTSELNGMQARLGNYSSYANFCCACFRFCFLFVVDASDFQLFDLLQPK